MKRSLIDRLHGNGNLFRAAQRAGLSLSHADRQIILRARYDARAEFCDSTIRYYEREGERGVRGHMALPIDVDFYGLNDTYVFGIKTRLYNVRGDHALNHSTVGVSSLVWNRIAPPDLSLRQVAFECLKEQFVETYCTIKNALLNAREALWK